MNDTTDIPVSEDAEVEMFFENQAEGDDDASEAPDERPEDADEAPEQDASEAEDDEIGEADEAEDEDDDPDDPNEDQEPANRYTVKVDGEERQVTLDELKRGYSGQAYIQKNMAEVSETRRALSEAMQVVTQERQVIHQMYQQAQATGFTPEPSPPSIEMLDADPIGYMQANAQYQSDLQRYQSERQNVQFLQQQEQQQQQYALQQQREQQKQQLLEVMPELSEPAKAKSFYERMVKRGGEYYNFSPDEIGGVLDARTVQVLADAVAYRELRDGKDKARQPREDAQTVTKQRGKSRSGGKITADKALERARKSQSPESWADVFLTT